MPFSFSWKMYEGQQSRKTLQKTQRKLNATEIGKNAQILNSISRLLLAHPFHSCSLYYPPKYTSILFGDFILFFFTFFSFCRVFLFLLCFIQHFTMCYTIRTEWRLSHHCRPWLGDKLLYLLSHSQLFTTVSILLRNLCCISLSTCLVSSYKNCISFFLVQFVAFKAQKHAGFVFCCFVWLSCSKDQTSLCVHRVRELGGALSFVLCDET